MNSHLQNIKTNLKNRDRDFPKKNRDMIFLPYRPPLIQPFYWSALTPLHEN